MVYLRAREVRQLLHNKFVVIMGDSIQRTVYKDLVLLLQKDCLLSPHQLEAKGELSFERDVLLEGGLWGSTRPQLPLHPGAPRPRYREVRQFRAAHHLVRFYFLTRAYSSYASRILDRLHRSLFAPDLLILNSCLGDLSRYGRHFRGRYQQDLESLFGHLRRALPESCLLVWNTTLPVAETVSGVLVPFPGLRHPSQLRQLVMEANFYSSTAADRYGFDVLDLHFHFRRASQHRQQDGVHWDELAHRHLSQLLLAHVADAWGVVLHGPDPVGRRGDALSGRHSDSRNRRQSKDRRGDRRPLPLPWLPPAAPHRRSPRRTEPSHHAHVPIQTFKQPHHRGQHLPSNLPYQARYWGPPTMCQTYHRDATSMRQPHHWDATSTRQTHYRDTTSRSQPDYRDAPSMSQPDHKDSTSTSHPDHKDSTSRQQPDHREATSMHQPHHREASSKSQPDHRDATSMRQPHHRDASPKSQTDHRDATSTHQSHHSDAPSVSQPYHRDTTSKRKPDYKDIFSTSQPDHRDAPSTGQPHHRDPPSKRQPHPRDTTSMHQPHHRDTTSKRQPDYRDISMSQPDRRDAPSTGQRHHRDAPSKHQPHPRETTSRRQPHHRDTTTCHTDHRNNPSQGQMEYPRETTAMFCESRLGPIRRISNESHGRRRAPPYPPRPPNGSYRCHPKWSGRWP